MQARGLHLGQTSEAVGTYETSSRTRSCNRFRGCTPWEPVAAPPTLHGSFYSCIPGEWSNDATHGTLRVGWNDVSFGPYARVLLYPDGNTPGSAGLWNNHVSCDLSLSVLGVCSAEGDWDNWATVGGARLAFASERESTFTKRCMRTVARTTAPRSASEHVDTEVVFHGALSL